MKRLGLFVVALVFAFSTMAFAAEKAVEPAKAEPAVAADKADVKKEVKKAKKAKKAKK